NRKTKKAVGTRLGHHRHEHHGADRHLVVQVREPGVKGPYRNLDRERERKCQECPRLDLWWNWRAGKDDNVERGRSALLEVLDVDPDDADKHKEAADRGEEEELVCRVDAAWSPARSDQQIGRYQHRFPEGEK